MAGTASRECILHKALGSSPISQPGPHHLRRNFSDGQQCWASHRQQQRLQGFPTACSFPSVQCEGRQKTSSASLQQQANNWKAKLPALQLQEVIGDCPGGREVSQAPTGSEMSPVDMNSFESFLFCRSIKRQVLVRQNKHFPSADSFVRVAENRGPHRALRQGSREGAQRAQGRRRCARERWAGCWGWPWLWAPWDWTPKGITLVCA